MEKRCTRSKLEMERCYDRTVDAVYRVCRMYFKDNQYDIEDAVQTTYLKWLTYNGEFQNDDHEKAWLIVTASNVCKNVLKHWWRQNADIDELEISGKEDVHQEDGLLPLLRELPEKQKIALYMHYYEGYSCKEIAGVMGKKEATIWEYLYKGKKNLKSRLEDERYA